MPVTLYSEALWYKSGFEDGDILTDLLDDYGLYERCAVRDEDVWHLPVRHEAIARLVERYLLPIMTNPPKLMRIGTIHNPIRVHDATLDVVVGVNVTVTDEQVMQIVHEILLERR